jgi:predicted enzyme related to lactoylglutathione lyase
MPVRYFVEDVEASKKFYIEALGFELIEQWGPPFAIIGREDLRVWLSGPGTSARKVTVNGEAPRAGGWSRIVLQVEDVEAVVPTVTGLGGQVLVDVISGPGGKQLLIADPDGNHIEIFQERS